MLCALAFLLCYAATHVRALFVFCVFSISPIMGIFMYCKSECGHIGEQKNSSLINIKLLLKYNNMLCQTFI